MRTIDLVSRSAARVSKFIELMRTQNDVLIPDMEWESDDWYVGDAFIAKGQNRNNRILAFYNISAKISNRMTVVGQPLSPPFKDFAKAYCRYMHLAQPTAFENVAKRLRALKFIEAAFHRLGMEPQISKLNVLVLNTAVAIASESCSFLVRYRYAGSMQEMYKFCIDRHFLDSPFQWTHGVSAPRDKTQSIDVESRMWRDKKLPSPESLHALAMVFRNGTTFFDRLYSAVCAVCVSIPIRAHEILQLRLDCEVEKFAASSEPGRNIKAYGIRVWPGKGHPPQIKWVPTPMVGLVKEAIERLRDMCAEGREVSAWYEANPGQLWLPRHLHRYRAKDLLPPSAVCQILGFPSNKYRWWIRKQKLEIDRLGRLKLSALSAKLLVRLPKRFPAFNGDPDQRYSDTLIVLLYRQGLRRRLTVPWMIQQATINSFGCWLSGKSGADGTSVFSRWGVTERDGSPIEITTHAFRHWLNTVAQFRGMSDLDIAKWSGRKVDQNQAYNHVSPDEILAQIREAVADGRAIGPMFEAAKSIGINQPVSQRDFFEAQIGSALVTDSGFCVHDYSLLPCQAHGDCLGCSENVFVKGDASHRSRISKRISLTEKQLSDATAAASDGLFGADRWVSHHAKAIQRMQEMLAIHDDPSIPDGTIINLGGGAQDNEVAMAMRDAAALSVGGSRLV